MARKRSILVPPPVLSDDEADSEEVAEEEEQQGPEGGDEESEEEEYEEEEVVRKSDPVKPRGEESAASKKAAVSDSGSDFESDSDTDSGQVRPSPAVAGYAVKPSVMIDSNSSKPSKSAGSKRPAELEPKDSPLKIKKKRNNGSASGIDEEEKKSAFQRVWSEDDEIAVLNGMIEFRLKKGMNVSDDMSAFHEFIKDSVHFGVSKAQLMDKIRRLKKKYQFNADRKEPVFSKAHDATIFKLGKKIWGDKSSIKVKKPHRGSAQNSLPLQNTEGPVLIKSKADEKKAIQPDVHKVNVEEKKLVEKSCNDEADNAYLEGFWSQYPFLKESMSLPPGWSGDSLAMEAIRSIGGAKAKAMEGEWRQLKLEEWKHHLMKIDLDRKHTVMMLEALDSNEA